MSAKDERIDEYTDEEVVEEVIPKIETPIQKDFYKIPARFGSIPVDELPLGCDNDKQYYKIYPRIALPFQKADRVSFGHPKLEPNRLIWGDNLHVMRMLPTNSIDLIYIDPPFFSDEKYSVLFGDQNEVRSFSDVWEGGMPSYLIWFNARLLEMKRLLKSSGVIFVHLDWHASHYVKQELDKIFGYGENIDGPGFKNEIIWCYSIGGKSKKTFGRKHDTILMYSKTGVYKFNNDDPKIRVSRKPDSHMKMITDENGIQWQEKTDKKTRKKYRYPLDKVADDYWNDIEQLNREDKERIGYPTQKPEKLLERIIASVTDEGDVVADFFCGGGTTPAVAQKLNRRWIACDQSRVAVAITQGRLESLYEKAK